MSRTIRRKHTRCFFIGRLKDNGKLKLVNEGIYQTLWSGEYCVISTRNTNYQTPHELINHFKILWYSDNVNAHNPPKSIKRLWIHKVRQDYKRDLRMEMDGASEGLRYSRYWQSKWYWYAF